MTASTVRIVDQPDQAATMLNPLRLRLLSELAQPDSATGLSRRIGLPRQQLNYHLRQLEAQGLLEVVGERKRRNCTERMLQSVAPSYLIGPGALGPVGADPARVPDRVSSDFLVALAGRVIGEVGTLRARADRAGKKLATLSLETEVRFATQEDQRAFGHELGQAVARLVAKYHDDSAPNGRRFRVMAAAYPTPSAAAKREEQ